MFWSFEIAFTIKTISIIFTLSILNAVLLFVKGKTYMLCFITQHLNFQRVSFVFKVIKLNLVGDQVLAYVLKML